MDPQMESWVGASSSDAREIDESSASGAHPIDAVLPPDTLARRTQRPPQYEAENRALVALAETLASRPQQLLQQLVDFAMELCGAESSGVSILEGEGPAATFRWHATAGVLSSQVGGQMPRSASPCGLVVDRDEIVLMREPARQFPAVGEVEPPIFENLLIPFHVADRPVGTLWVLSHTPSTEFDSEHARLLTSLARFASAAYQMAQSLREAERASEAKTQFLATISHELRTPLTGIIGYTDLLASDVVGESSTEQKEMLHRIQASSWHLVSIIDEILLLSRAEVGKEEVRWAEADLAEIVREVVEIVEPQVTEKQLELRLVGIDRPIRAMTDPGKVRRVLINLLGNAAKYTAEGEIEIRAVRRVTGDLAIHVRDTGWGIDPADQQTIFDPFTQCDASHTRTNGGIGLGLAICRRLARMLGGDVVVRSAPGAGSTFTFTIPLTRGDA